VSVRSQIEELLERFQQRLRERIARWMVMLQWEMPGAVVRSTIV